MGNMRKRSFVLAGHATSVALEQEFWDTLERYASAERLSLSMLLTRLDNARGERPLASACRLAALAFVGRPAPT